MPAADGEAPKANRLFVARQSDVKDDNDEDAWIIPPPPPKPNGARRNYTIRSSATALDPLTGGGKTKRARASSTSNHRSERKPTRLLFGESDFNFVGRHGNHDTNSIVTPARPSGIAGFFFGFMYEEPFDDSLECEEEDYTSDSSSSIWNRLNMTLFLAFTLTTAASSVPITLIPTVGQDLLGDSTEASGFTSRAAASAVFGTACGKFLNGPVGDVLGARRTSVLYSLCLSLALIGMAACGTTSCAAWTCFFVEFFQSVQWPCIIVILATHYRPSNPALYEGGIYVTSIASRFGSLVGIPFYSYLLRQSHWRIVSLVAAWIALIGCSVSYLFMNDSPYRANEPQNPLDAKLRQQIASTNLRDEPQQFFAVLWNILKSILLKNLVPSLDHVLKSGTFWIVALAHTGSSMIRTSERILGTYFRDTSFGTLSENRAGGLAVFSAFGTILGLAISGNMFIQRKERQRKWLVSRLYMVTIVSCYALAILAIPRLRYLADAPGLILFFQVLASFCMGYGIAVMFYTIPGLVGAAFGNNKGLFSAYVDGVAYGFASIVWRVVGSAVEGSSPQGGGWAYGWAAVALLVILCAILMVEFMEHYFVRACGKHHGSYETIIFA